MECLAVRGQGNYALMEHLAVRHDPYKDYVATGKETFSEKRKVFVMQLQLCNCHTFWKWESHPEKHCHA